MMFQLPRQWGSAVVLVLLLTAPGTSAQDRDDRVPTLVAQLLRQPQRSRRAPEIGAILRLGDSAVGPLSALVRDRENSSPETRSWAAYLLRRLGKRAAVPALVDALEDPSWLVRKNAVNGLGALTARSAIPELIKRLEDPARTVRMSSASAINKLATPAFMPHLAEAYRRSKHDDARALLITLLGQLETFDAARVLVRATRDSSAACRQSATYHAATLHPESLAPHMARLLDDPHPGVRGTALRMLPRVKPFIELSSAQVRAALSDTEPEVRIEAAAALSGPRWRRLLTGALARERKPDVRIALGLAIGETDPRRAVAVMARITEDPRQPRALRVLALDGLAQIGTRGALDALRLQILSHDPLLSALAPGLWDKVRQAPERERPPWWHSLRFPAPRAPGAGPPPKTRKLHTPHYRLISDIDPRYARQLILVMELLRHRFDVLYARRDPLYTANASQLAALATRESVDEKTGERVYETPTATVRISRKPRKRTVAFAGGKIVTLWPDGTRRVKFPWRQTENTWNRTAAQRVTSIRLFRRRADFRAYAARADSRWPFLQDAGGYYSATRREIVSYGKAARGDMLVTLSHETQHQVLARYLPNAPIWLNEGLSEYVERARYHGGRLRLGSPHEAHLSFLKRLLAERRLLAIRDLIRLSYDEFHNDNFGPEEIGHYAQAWALVYFLREADGAKHRPMFDRFFADLLEKAKPFEAFRHAMKQHGLDWKTLDARWRAFLADLSRRPSPKHQ